MKCLKIGILALAIADAVSPSRAADYEVFAPTHASAPDGQHWDVERLDNKNQHRYHCSAFSDRTTKKLTGQCTERPGFYQKPAVEGPNLQKAMSYSFGGLPVGYWQIDRTTGKTEFCTLGPTQCMEVTPK